MSLAGSILTPAHPSLVLGPDLGGNMLEVIMWRRLADEVQLAIHAMSFRPVFPRPVAPKRGAGTIAERKSQPGRMLTAASLSDN